MSRRQSENANSKIRRFAEELRLAHIDFSSVRSHLIEYVILALKVSIARVRISLILPRLIENRNGLVKCLTGTPYEAAIPLVDDYIRRRDIILRERRLPLMDHGIIRILDYFQNNYQMYKFLTNSMKTMTVNEQRVLHTFQLLEKVAIAHLQCNAQTHIEKERKFQKLYKEIEVVKLSVDRLEEETYSHREKFRSKSMARSMFLARFEIELADKQEEHDKRVRQECEKYNQVLVNSDKKSKEKQYFLTHELANAKIIFEKQAKEHKKLQQTALEEKNKVLIQLQTLVQKYDDTISEKRLENLALESQYQEAKKELDDFMEIYYYEESIYNNVVVRREIQEQRRRDERVLNFMLHRAARKIQQFYRNWKALSKKVRRSTFKKNKPKNMRKS